MGFKKENKKNPRLRINILGSCLLFHSSQIDFWIQERQRCFCYFPIKVCPIWTLSRALIMRWLCTDSWQERDHPWLVPRSLSWSHPNGVLGLTLDQSFCADCLTNTDQLPRQELTSWQCLHFEFNLFSFVKTINTPCPIYCKAVS